MKKQPKVKENGPSLWCIPPLRAADNKYTRGHVLVLGGASMTGAAKLAALAAQRAGAGLVTIAATAATWPAYASAMLSVMVRRCDAKGWNDLVRDERIRAVVIGPAAGLDARTKNAMRAAATATKNMVLDADALTLLASDAALRKALQPAAKIITPHEGEYARLAHALKLDVTQDKPERAMALAKVLNAVVVLKGSTTIVADGVQMLCTQPPAWLATGGTGDVLAGIIAALVGQGMGLFDAAAAGVWLHSEAAREHGRGMIAEDVIASIPTILEALG